MFVETKENIGEYVKGKLWYWYLPVWLFGVYVFFNLLSFDLGGDAPFVLKIAHAFDFMLHEAAHMFTSFLPAIVSAAAGSLSELLLGGLLIWGAFKGKTYFASMICCLWFMLACQATADYMSDARTQALPLVNFDMSGVAPIHDWHFVFSQLGILEWDTLIGGTIRVFGTIAGLFGLVFAAWLMFKMASATDKKKLNEQEAQLLHEQAAIALSSPAPPEHFEKVKEGSLYPTVKTGWMAEDKKGKSKATKGGNLYPAATKGRLAEEPKNTSEKSV